MFCEDKYFDMGTFAFMYGNGNVITTSDRPVMFDICQLWQHIRNLVFNIVTGWYDKQSILTATERDPESTDINVQSKYCYLY